MNLILAADEKWGIGRDGGLLCSIPSDLAYFRKQTAGKTVIMGRVTLESLPGSKGLPNRRNIVITRKNDYVAENAEVVSSIEEAMEKAGTGDDVMVIGGAEIYRQFLPYCHTCYITKIYGDFNADRFFVNLDQDGDFTCRPIADEIEENGIRYRFFEYTRKGK